MLRLPLLLLLTTGPLLLAAEVTMTANDALGSTSFNAAGQWDSLAAPTSGNHYISADFRLRTPPDGASHVFAGDSLIVSDNADDDTTGLTYKGTGTSGVMTIDSLVLAGGQLLHLNGPGDLWQIDGSIEVTADSRIWAKQGPIDLLATLSGSSTLTIPADDNNGDNFVSLLAADNTFTGSIVNNGDFRLEGGARLRFAIAAAGVSNRISGSGSTMLDGSIEIDTSASAAPAGSAWTLVAAGSTSYGASFAVAGYTAGAGSPGSRVWTSATGSYQFDESTGTLTLVSVNPLVPYTADADTLILYHLDETGGSAVTDATGTFGGVFSTGNAAPAAPKAISSVDSFNGFGKAFAIGVNDGVGVDFNGNSTWNFDAVEAGDRFDTTLLGSQFTLEALVNLPSLTQAAPMHIWGADGDIQRAFQFRINNGGVLNFDLLGSGNGAALTFDLNTLAGTHAFAPNQWFHVAMTYDGSAGPGTEVVRLYWTRLDSGVAEANLVASSAPGAIVFDDSDNAPLVFGNEGRGVGGLNEGLQGLLDEGRVSTIARDASGFLFYADTTDSDGDGLPDYWEIAHGLDPDDATGANGATGDPDGDGSDNQAEFNAGSDPQSSLSTPDDIDGDGLADTWEKLWFGNLSHGPGEDADGDGFDNLAESQANTDPTDASSVPGDTDGDGQPDEWENENLGGLAYGPYDDPDGDGQTNLSERLGGSDPLDATSSPPWKAPAVALLRDSVPATNACIMPSNATYGRAINGLSFQDQIVVTFNDYQYTAWYDSNGSTQTVVLARRTVDDTGVGPWQVFPTGSEFTRGDESAWDAHNVIAIGICPQDGTLHVAWDHHGHTLRYRRSVDGLCTTNPGLWGTAGMLNAEQNWLVSPGAAVNAVTYPQFVTGPDGRLALNWRTGSSGNGDQLFCTYLPATDNWTAATLFLQRSGNYNGSTSRCAYINGFDYAPDGSIHVTWTWREGAGSSNHDICYASSGDGGVTWQNTAGETIADTSSGGYISLNSPGIVIKRLDLNQLLINQQTQCVDLDGRVHAMMLHRREDPGYEYPNITTSVYSTLGTAYYHYFLEPGTHQWQQRRIPPEVFPVGSRPSLGYDAEGDLYAAFVTYSGMNNVFPGYTSGRLAIASASKESQYSDWKVVQVLDVPNGFTGEPLIDQPRLANDGILSVYLQANSASSASGGSALHVYDFVVHAAEPRLDSQARISARGDDALITAFGDSGSSFQLETSTDLILDWTPVGTPLAGQGTLLAFPHPDGMLDPRRFYRVSETTP